MKKACLYWNFSLLSLLLVSCYVGPQNPANSAPSSNNALNLLDNVSVLSANGNIILKASFAQTKPLTFQVMSADSVTIQLTQNPSMASPKNSTLNPGQTQLIPFPENSTQAVVFFFGEKDTTPAATAVIERNNSAVVMLATSLHANAEKSLFSLSQDGTSLLDFSRSKLWLLGSNQPAEQSLAIASSYLIGTTGNPNPSFIDDGFINIRPIGALTAVDGYLPTGILASSYLTPGIIADTASTTSNGQVALLLLPQVDSKSPQIQYNNALANSFAHPVNLKGAENNYTGGILLSTQPSSAYAAGLRRGVKGLEVELLSSNNPPRSLFQISGNYPDKGLTFKRATASFSLGEIQFGSIWGADQSAFVQFENNTATYGYSIQGELVYTQALSADTPLSMGEPLNAMLCTDHHKTPILAYQLGQNLRVFTLSNQQMQFKQSLSGRYLQLLATDVQSQPLLFATDDTGNLYRYEWADGFGGERMITQSNHDVTCNVDTSWCDADVLPFGGNTLYFRQHTIEDGTGQVLLENVDYASSLDNYLTTISGSTVQSYQVAFSKGGEASLLPYGSSGALPEANIALGIVLVRTPKGPVVSVLLSPIQSTSPQLVAISTASQSEGVLAKTTDWAQSYPLQTKTPSGTKIFQNKDGSATVVTAEGTSSKLLGM